MEQLEGIYERTGRASTYAYLLWATATQNASRGALLQHVREECSKISQLVLFFDLEWMKVPSARVDQLLARSELDRFRHHLAL